MGSASSGTAGVAPDAGAYQRHTPPSEPELASRLSWRGLKATFHTQCEWPPSPPPPKSSTGLAAWRRSHKRTRQSSPPVAIRCWRAGSNESARQRIAWARESASLRLFARVSHTHTDVPAVAPTLLSLCGSHAAAPISASGSPPRVPLPDALQVATSHVATAASDTAATVAPLRSKATLLTGASDSSAQSSSSAESPIRQSAPRRRCPPPPELARASL
mmetsp:Transcript_9235/g.37791  ORF Transcript_9235/g.37791 Transcript_9235/m.37791 type:complete len:218 (-) Transcript_9235:473-1126(-)